MNWPAWVFDGVTAERRQVALTPSGPNLIVDSGNDEPEVLSQNALCFVDDRGVEIVVGMTGRNGWRLVIPAPVDPMLAAALPARGSYGRWVDRLGLVPASLIGTLASALVMAAFYMLPHWLAPLVPDRWMSAYGNALIGDFGGKFCQGPGGQAALDRIAYRIAPDLPGLKVRVVDVPIVNAATLPGGQIVIFRELLSDSGSPEEFAGVLAHEIAHIRHHDVAEAMVREMGFGLVLGALGGSYGGQVQQLASLSYSRRAEAAADATAIASLRRASISPAATATFFERLDRDDKRMIGGSNIFVYLSTHPMSASRAEAFRKGGRNIATAPILSRDEWDALIDICHNDPRQRKAGDDWLDRFHARR